MGRYAEHVAAGLCDIDLMTRWCAVHDTDCGPQRDFEAVDYVAGPDDPDAFPARGRLVVGRVPDEVRKPAGLIDQEGNYR